MTLEQLHSLMKKNGWTIATSLPSIGRISYRKDNNSVFVTRDYKDIELSCERVRTMPKLLKDACLTSYNEIAVYDGSTEVGRVIL